jgi:CRP/FNR family transcriptional regulator, cyclic AMP receptor protein
MALVSSADLATTSLFAALDEPSRSIVGEWLEVDAVLPGHHLTHEDTMGYAFYVLHQGTADVFVNGKVVRTLGPGDFFGEISILGDGRQTATVTVTSPATVWTMFGTRFRQLQQQHPEIAVAIEKVASERLAQH